MTRRQTHAFNGDYRGLHLNHVAFPLGGIGAGMICLEGTGAFSHVSLRHQPHIFHDPLLFAALHVKGARTARLLEGPVPLGKAFGGPDSGGGRAGDPSNGLPRFAAATFQARFPFGRVQLRDNTMPVSVELTGWSPFIPGDADNSSLPVAGLEYRIRNRTDRPLTAVFSFHAANFMARGQDGNFIKAIPGGFVLSQSPVTSSPFIASWKISRLFDRRGGVADAAPVRLADDAGWKPLTSGSNGFVNAHAMLGDADGLVYLATRVTAARNGTWDIRLGHDGGARLFMDGTPVAAQPALVNPAQPGRTHARVTLAAGEHELVVALDTCQGLGQGIFLNFSQPAGGTVSGFPTPEAWTSQIGDSTDEGHFTAFTAEPATRTDCAWFRGGFFDILTMVWNTIAAGKPVARGPHRDGQPGGGASLYVPFRLKGRAEKTIRLHLAWYVPGSTLRIGGDPAAAPGGGCAGACSCQAAPPAAPPTHTPWYAARFKNAAEVAAYWRRHYDRLLAATRRFSDCFYDTTLPPEVIEAVAANLTILKSPTCLRDAAGRLWGWEGCCDGNGCCHGSCTHVWNYAQALPHLFPGLERSLRETEFNVCQDERGHQTFRASLPIRPPDHTFHAAADGQLGGIIKLYREWRISGDTAWMQSLWPRARASLDYCIATWDPDHTGTLLEPHHNTYDIEFWGADGMCTSFYLGALQAAVVMGTACHDNVRSYEDLLRKGKQAMETTLWNGEYYVQKIQWKSLRTSDPTRAQTLRGGYTPEALKILKREGPKYQYGDGCLSDGVLGDWLARAGGLDPVLDPIKITRHLASVFRYNYRPSLADHANPQRPGYAYGQEGGLLLCSWPRKSGGGKLSLPFPYSDEVWTGIEYQVAAHLIMMGRESEGLRIVRTARDRYDGRTRNPFNEYECGHWYARAMSSYGLLQALSGARYDAVTKILHLRPRIKGDFRAFLATATGFGTVGIRKGKPFLAVKHGVIPVDRIEATP